ncbi:short-chain dehydrogenase protein [Rutstroemia sp. NJR-2017a BVV2]|nr:short-chain dehydrogenase protein [Rutstroemia sp. NJR-2017a BVV2]PQE25222.1 short-chain dehydrogenase protein [Rutstroemia sp. NJR-2017a BVV2]
MTSHSESGEKTEGRDVASAFADEVKQETNMESVGIFEQWAKINSTYHWGGPKWTRSKSCTNVSAQSPSLPILTGSSTEKVAAVEKILKETYPNVPTRILKLDLVSFDAVRSAAAEVNAYAEKSIDILIKNAGLMNIPERTLSVDGFVVHLATNYPGSFLFTNLLMD